MTRAIHFEIHAADVQRAVDFYRTVFGWEFQDWSEYAGVAYFGAVTGADDQPGINGAIMQRAQPNPPSGAPVMGAVLTMGVEDVDAVVAAVEKAGGSLALAKHALPGMAWQAYCLDTEGNVFGVHQPDPDAA